MVDTVLHSLQEHFPEPIGDRHELAGGVVESHHRCSGQCQCEVLFGEVEPVVKIPGASPKIARAHLNLHPVSQKSLRLVLDDRFGHEHTHAAGVKFGHAELLQVAHACLVYHAEDAVVADVPAIVEIRDADMHAGGERHVLRKL